MERKLADIGVCKSVKVTNISETSWFENAVLMGDIKGAGGLLVNQYSYNWPPFGDGTGLGKGTLRERCCEDQASSAQQPGGGLGRHRETVGPS